MNWLLIFALAIIGVFAFIGWRAGFVKSVFSLISTIAVIIITILVMISIQMVNQTRFIQEIMLHIV